MKYRYLRGRLQQLGIDQKTLGRDFDLSQTSISHRFSGRTPWTMTEMYRMLDICGAKPEEMHLYFPRDGIDPEMGYKLQMVRGGAS